MQDAQARATVHAETILDVMIYWILSTGDAIIRPAQNTNVIAMYPDLVEHAVMTPVAEEAADAHGAI